MSISSSTLSPAEDFEDDSPIIHNNNKEKDEKGSVMKERKTCHDSRPVFNCSSPINDCKVKCVEKPVKKNENKLTPTKRKSGEMKQLTLTPSGELSSKLETEAKGKTRRRKKKADDSQKQTKKIDVTIDTLFPVLRRSERRCAKDIKEVQRKTVEYCVLNNIDDGLKIFQTENRGRGIMATRPFFKDQFVVEYKGDLLNEATARKRESDYQKDPSIGCYMYYFLANGTKYCVDATKESGYLGRLLNHSRSKPNCYTKSLMIDSRPYLVLFAKRDIDIGEELVYDYGERDKTTLLQHPWLKS